MDKAMLQSWREGLLSDVEMLTHLVQYLPVSESTDAVIEVVGKMIEEEKAEWNNRADHFVATWEIDL